MPVTHLLLSLVRQRRIDQMQKSVVLPEADAECGNHDEQRDDQPPAQLLQLVLCLTLERRDGFDGPITVSVAGLPEGITAEPLEIPAGKKDGEIGLQCGKVPAGTHAQVTVTGTGTNAAWQSVKISSGGGEGATYATVSEATPGVAVVFMSRPPVARGGAGN